MAGKCKEMNKIKQASRKDRPPRCHFTAVADAFL